MLSVADNTDDIVKKPSQRYGNRCILREQKSCKLCIGV